MTDVEPQAELIDLSTLTPELIGQEIIAIIADSLDLQADEVTLDSLLLSDLDADSLDILDVNYRVNRRFGVNLPVSELRKRFEESEEPWIDERGRITDHGFTEVKVLLPEVEERVKPGDVVEEIFAVLTVADLVSMLDRRLESPGGAPTDGIA